VITRAALDDAVNQALNANYFHGRMTTERRRELERTQIEVLIRRELNILGGLGNGMVLPDTAAVRSRTEIEGRLGTEQYEAALAKAGMSREDHTRALAETLLAKRAYEKFVQEPAGVSEEEIRTAFEKAPEHWRMPESAHILHILLKVHPLADEESKTRIRVEADGLMERLAAGEDFGSLAAEYSQDMYRIKGGDLGWVHRGRLVEALENVVWEAEVGKVVGPIRSEEGFHLIKVLGRRSARPMEFSEVEPMLREQLEKKKLDAAEASWFGPLREKNPVVYMDPALGEGN
jgi:peptidyl-prolyl cis-trans isomerase C